MNKYWKKKWLEALRSGKYLQARGRLRRVRRKSSPNAGQFGYCCLGVLCAIHPKTKFDENGVATYKQRKNKENLPGMLAEDLRIGIYDRVTLVEMNDKGSRFSTIANWIENNL